jgi:hypothetical protein
LVPKVVGEMCPGAGYTQSYITASVYAHACVTMTTGVRLPYTHVRLYTVMNEIY